MSILAAAAGDVRQTLQARAQPRLDVGHPPLERRDELVLALLEAGDDVLEPALHLAAARLADLGEPFTEHPLRLAGEGLDRPVELPREAARRFFARRPDRLVELERRLLGQPARLARDRALDLLDEPPLDVAERLRHLADAFAELAVDLFGQAPLAVSQAVGDLVQRAPALGGVRLELVRRLLDHILDLAFLLGAEPRDRGAILLCVCEQPFGLAREASLRVGNQLPLTLLEARELAGETLAQPLEVLGPGPQLRLELLLRRDQPAGQLREDALLGADDLVASFLRQLPLLLGELSCGFCSLQGDRSLELLLACRELGVDDRAQPRLRPGQKLVFGLASSPHGRSIVGQTLRGVTLQADLESIAVAAAALVGPGEALAGVIPTEPEEGRRVYLCAFEGADRSWIALDSDGVVVQDRRLVRRAVSIAALCELAEEAAGGGKLDELRATLVSLRLTEHPEGIEEAEEAALELERTIERAPRVASPGYLDALGAAVRRLEQSLGEGPGSPFAEAMKQGSAVVGELEREVTSGYKGSLT